MGKDSKSRILLVDDHPVLRMGIAELINSEGTLEVCGEATNLAEAYQMVLKLKPDLEDATRRWLAFSQTAGTAAQP